MNNYAAETFAYVMRIKLTATSDFYEQGMRENYLLEEPGEAYNKYRTGTEWVELEPSKINDLPIGAMFIGVGKRDSMSRNYVVIAKDQEGHAVWFPLDTGAEQVVQIHEFNDALGKFEPLFRGELATIIMKMQARCTPGKFYLSTDINGFKLPFLTYDDDDDDDDELEEPDDEDQELLDRLKDEMDAMNDEDEDDDDDGMDDDEEEHDHDVVILSNSVFLCVEINGQKEFVTVGEAIRMDDEIDELQHRLEKLKKRAVEAITGAQDDLDKHSKINIAFNQAFPSFIERSGLGKVMHEDEPEHEIDISIPQSSDEYDDVLTKPETVEEPEPVLGVDASPEVKGDTDGDPVPSPSKYLPDDDPVESVSMDDDVIRDPETGEPVNDEPMPEETPKQDFGDW